ncbi:type II toxin-antitoxin system RelE/ParE family toxin [Glaciecola sp. SC05]|uniref:type II toxin-antitoxin system RelE/ParE family toxin n=1 Tax=Glaciecola sp. SC05 TaxID=1987355 RepID=UPI003526DC26
MAEIIGKLHWSQEAFDDLDAITDFILKDSPQYAEIVGDALIEAAEHAFNHPHYGRMVPELQNPTIREKIVYSYRVIYELNEHENGHDVSIIAIASGAQLLVPILDERKPS